MNFGTPLTSVATKALLLGSGELGKEVALELHLHSRSILVLIARNHFHAIALEL